MAINSYGGFLIMLIGCVTFLSCQEKDRAQSVIDQSIAYHGGKKFNKSHIEFDFRNRHYVFQRSDGIFEYQRIFKDSIWTVKDILTNEGLTRFRDDEKEELSDEWKRRYSNSVNSVAYFSLLPFGLNDPAVIKEILPDGMVEGKEYIKIKVTFREEGGGEDFNDIFLFWINKANYSLDYFGYVYFNDGGGTRFRKAIKQHRQNGIVLQDYLNYGSPKTDIPIETLDQVYESGQINLLSEILLENVVIK